MRQGQKYDCFENSIFEEGLKNEKTENDDHSLRRSVVFLHP